MFSKYVFIVLPLNLLVFSSCNEYEETSGGGHFYEISESLYPLLFTPGSYWIYENLENGDIDSLLLTENVIDTSYPVNVGGGYYSLYQIFDMTYLSQYQGEYSEYYIGYVIKRGKEHNNSYLYLSSHDIGDSLQNAVLSDIYDSLVIKGKTYHNVVKMDIKKDDYIENDMYLFYADSIGVVKKDIIKEAGEIETWLLLESNIGLLKME